MFDPWVWKMPWRREWLPAPEFLPGEFHGQRSLAGYSPCGRKKLDTTEQLSLHFISGLSNLYWKVEDKSFCLFLIDGFLYLARTCASLGFWRPNKVSFYSFLFGKNFTERTILLLFKTFICFSKITHEACF